MYTSTPSSKHRQYTSHICDHRWPPAHPWHNTTHNNNNNEINNNNNNKYEEWQQKHHKHQATPVPPPTIRQWPKRCESRPWWVFLFFSSHFFILNIMDSYYWSYGGAQGRWRRGEQAISTFFFFLIFCIFIYTYTNHLTGCNGILKLWRYLWEVTTKRTGPNDTNRIVWAISNFFFFHSKSFP